MLHYLEEAANINRTITHVFRQLATLAENGKSNVYKSSFLHRQFHWHLHMLRHDENQSDELTDTLLNFEISPSIENNQNFYVSSTTSEYLTTETNAAIKYLIS